MGELQFDRQTYLKDNASDDISGIVVIETDESEGYRVTENRDSGWCKPFWMPASELHGIMSFGGEEVGQISSDQFLKVCRTVGVAE